MSLNYILLLSVYQGRKIVVMVEYLCAVGPVVLNIQGHYWWPTSLRAIEHILEVQRE